MTPQVEKRMKVLQESKVKTKPSAVTASMGEKSLMFMFGSAKLEVSRWMVPPPPKATPDRPT
jgi:hypothetical protein